MDDTSGETRGEPPDGFGWITCHEDYTTDASTVPEWGIRAIAGVDPDGHRVYEWIIDNGEHGNRLEMVGLLQVVAESLTRQPPKAGLMMRFET